MDDHVFAAALALGVEPSAVAVALRPGPGRARLIAGLLGVSVAELVESIEPLVTRGVPLTVALEHVLLRAGECGAARGACRAA